MKPAALDTIRDASPLLTSAEAAVYLRLVEADARPDEMASAVRTLQRIARERGLRPVALGREHRYHREELDRWLRAEIAGAQSGDAAAD